MADMTEREQFEAWMRKEHHGHSLTIRTTQLSEPVIEYLSVGTQHKWLGWQAARASQVEAIRNAAYTFNSVNQWLMLLEDGERQHVNTIGKWELADKAFAAARLKSQPSAPEVADSMPTDAERPAANAVPVPIGEVRLQAGSNPRKLACIHFYGAGSLENYIGQKLYLAASPHTATAPAAGNQEAALTSQTAKTDEEIMELARKHMIGAAQHRVLPFARELLQGSNGSGKDAERLAQQAYAAIQAHKECDFNSDHPALDKFLRDYSAAMAKGND